MSTQDSRREFPCFDPVVPTMTPTAEMEITWKDKDNVTIVRLAGRLDITQSDDFENAVVSSLQNNPRDLLINLSGITYMSSSGIRALLAIYRQSRALERSMLICDPSPAVKKILDVVDIDQIFQIYDREEQAIAALQS